MAISQTGGNYRNQSELQRRDRVLGEALDDIASQIQAVRTQGNFGQNGPVPAPGAPTAIKVVGTSGFATVTLTDKNAPDGLLYIIQYSTTSNFQNPIQVDNGISLTWQQYLKGLTLFFRAAAMFPASPMSPWIYFGSQASPTAVKF